MVKHRSRPFHFLLMFSHTRYRAIHGGNIQVVSKATFQHAHDFLYAKDASLRKGTDTCMTLLRSLANSSFALLWSGQTISRLGDSFYTIALALWVLQKTGSAAAMGLVLICSFVPTLFLLLVGGAFVDRFSRLGVMLSSDVLRVGIVGLVALLAISGRLELWHVLVMSALFGVVDAFFYPAYGAIVPDIVEESDLPSANSLRSISLELAGIIGPALAGLLVARDGTGLAFGLDGLSFLISAVCLLIIPRKKVLLKAVEGESGILADVNEGLQTVLHSPWLWITITIATFSTLTLAGPFDAALPLLVKQRFGSTVQVYGALMALTSVGSLLAAILLGRVKRLRHRGYLLYGAWLTTSLMLIPLGLPSPLVIMALAVCIFGAGITTLGLAWTNSLQELVPSEQLGRVYSIDALGSNVLVPVGYGLAGIAADHFGPPLVFIVGGIISATVIALGLLHPAIRAVD